ncbi:MAG: FprA family A-type flavoprotein [Candidatus Fimivivens sp.]
MYCVRKVTDDLFWVGANDHRVGVFENMFPIPRGVTYNSYLLMDESTVLFDTVDWSASRQFIENIMHVLNGRTLDYLVINHLEPDHAASIGEILIRWPKVTLIGNQKTFALMCQFGYKVDIHKCLVVKDNETYSFGKHKVRFLFAPMVHWPEVMVTFDETNGVLFSADVFGTFGTLDGKLFADEVDFDRDWLDDARRYLSNIVGKYGPQIQKLLKKVAGIEQQVKIFCPLHGPVWRKNLNYFLEKYDVWSRYEPEKKGVLIAYASMYGNTESVAQAVAAQLCESGMTNVALCDVSSTDISQLISEVFKYSHLVLASTTYNLGIYPKMYDFLHDMKALNVQNRVVAIIENGSWACKTGDQIQKFITEEMKNMVVLNERIRIVSSLGADKIVEIESLVHAIFKSMS